MERNSAGGSSTRAATDMRVPVEYLYPRHTSVVEWMNKTYGYKPYMSGGISLLRRASQTEREVEQFKWVVESYKPRVAVLMTPLGVDLADSVWNHAYCVDGAQHGDVLAGVWQVGTLHLAPINCFVEEPVNHPLCTMQGRYRSCGLNPSGDRRGVVDIQDIPHCIGLEVWVRLETGERISSVNSHQKTRSLNDLRANELRNNFPRCGGLDDLPRLLTGGEVCMVMGGSQRWGEIDGNTNFERDTIWRSTPLVVCGGNC